LSMTIKCFPLLIILQLSGSAFCQSINTAKLDSFFNVLSLHNKIMGSFAIEKNGKLVYKRSIGYCNDNILDSENTLYHIGSVTKMFTATMIFQLIDEGKLSLNSTLDKWFPAIPNSKQITIEMLLEHRSGLYDFVNDNSDKFWITNAHTKNEILNVITTGKPHFLPNTNFSYNNSGYLLLTYIIENITGHSYNDNLQKRICTKVGLKNTYSPISNKLKLNEAASYTFSTNWQKITDIYFPNVVGVGDVLSTPTDLIAFDEALLGGKLISPSSIKLMQTFKEGYFGMGMERVPFYSHTGYGHGGDTYGTHTLVANFSDDQLIVSYCINGEAFPHNDVAIAMLSVCYNSKYQIPVFKTITLSNQILDKYVGVYSNAQIPLKVTITNSQGVLTAQGTGQPSFTLEAVENDKFKQDVLGVTMSFDSEKKEMTLNQAGGIFLFKKD